MHVNLVFESFVSLLTSAVNVGEKKSKRKPNSKKAEDF